MAALFSPKSRLKVIMLPNEVFALACRAYYEEQGLIVDKTNGHFAHCPLPKGMGETGYYLLWEHHQQQGLLQSRDVGRQCFWVGDTKKWLTTCSYWPDNYFELWDIYEEFAVYRQKESGREWWDKLSPSQREERVDRMRVALFSQMSPEEFKSFQSKAGKAVPFDVRSANSYRARIKAVEITFPDGKIGTYPSLNLAGMALGVDPETISKWVRKHKPVRQGNYKGSVAKFV